MAASALWWVSIGRGTAWEEEMYRGIRVRRHGRKGRERQGKAREGRSWDTVSKGCLDVWVLRVLFVVSVVAEREREREDRC